MCGQHEGAEDKFNGANKIDLGGNTLLPGFIDPQSHFEKVSNTMGQLNLSPPPVSDVTNIPQILEKLKAYKVEDNIPDGEWIFAWGYDDNQLAEKRHPNKKEIDGVLPNNPVYLDHASGHMGVANSLALEKMGVTADSKNPEGGNIDRYPGTQKPNGLVQETAMYPFVGNMLQVFDSKSADYFESTQNYYAEHGITTTQDGLIGRQKIDFYKNQAREGNLKIDLIALAGFTELETNLNDSLFTFNSYEKACESLDQPLDKDRRTVIIHSQFVRPDQLETYVKYKMLPSFFTNHAFFWGDVHMENLGEKRASFLSPIATADSLGIKYTNHSDATVTPVDPMMTVWSAVNRESRSGAVIGDKERATPYQALKAIGIGSSHCERS